MFRRAKSKRGIVAVLVGLTLVIIVGVAAIAVDGGLLLDTRRRVQAAADAASLAAASDLYGRYPSNLGVDVNHTARDCARSNAASNGYNNDGSTNTVTVNIPPLSGPFVTKPGYAEVIVAYQQPRGLSAIFGSGNLQVESRAVAMGKWTSLNNGIIVLDPYSKGALTLTGNAEAIVVGAGVVVDSNNAQAAITTGNGDATAPSFDITGVPGISTSGGGAFHGTTSSGVPPTPDPLKYLPEPVRTSLPIANGGQPIHLSGSIPSSGVTLYPGVYNGGIQITSQSTGTVTLQPGLYYMYGGGFILSSKATVVANGVMIYNDPLLSSDVVSLAGGSNVRISPITTGIYKGITIFQRRSATQTLDITGSGNMAISGTFYAAHALAKLSGQGDNNIMGSQYIVWQATLNGNGSINVSWSTDTARVRLIRLVE